MSKGVQAKHIPDAAMIDAIARVEAQRALGATRWELAEAFPELPPKVVLAKCGQLVRRGLIQGCTCGCRGDFTVAP